MTPSDLALFWCLGFAVICVVIVIVVELFFKYEYSREES